MERKSHVLVAAKLSDKPTDTFYLATATAFKITPEKWRKTLMVDNGKECVQFRKIEEATGMNVYFADPYSPWQRGTNENTNGLLHHCFHKGINWRKVTDLMFATVEKKLNNRLRKCLNY